MKKSSVIKPSVHVLESELPASIALRVHEAHFCSTTSTRFIIIIIVFPHCAMGRIRPPQALSSTHDLAPPSGFHSRLGLWTSVLSLLTSSKLFWVYLAVFSPRVQNKSSLETLLGFPLRTCPIHVHFLRVRLTMMSSCLQMLRTSRFIIFCGHLIPNKMRRHL